MENRRGLQTLFFLTKGEDLPEKDAVRPHVALHCVNAVKDALGGHPFHRQAGLEEQRVLQTGTSWQLTLRPVLPAPASPCPVPSPVPILITYVAFYHIVRVIHDITGQAEVTNLGYPSV